MLARQDLGRRHQRGLGAGLDRVEHGEQRHHRLAAADIALQQPQHARRRRHVGGDLGERLAAAPRSARRAGRAITLSRSAALGLERAAGQAPLMRPHQRDRELVGQQLVDRRGAGAPAPPGSRSAALCGACAASSASRQAGQLCAREIGRRRAIPADRARGRARRRPPSAPSRRLKPAVRRIDRLDRLQPLAPPRASTTWSGWVIWIWLLKCSTRPLTTRVAPTGSSRSR